MSLRDWKKWSLPFLRNKAEHYHLSTSGNKEAIAKRLFDYCQHGEAGPSSLPTNVEEPSQPSTSQATEVMQPSNIIMLNREKFAPCSGSLSKGSKSRGQNPQQSSNSHLLHQSWLQISMKEKGDEKLVQVRTQSSLCQLWKNQV